MSSITLARNSDVLFPSATKPAGSEGLAVLLKLKQIQKESRSRASDWMPTIDASIAEIRQECNAANWDGYGAPPIKDAAIDKARWAAEALNSIATSAVPAPDVVPENDGDVSLSWTRDRALGLSISFSDHDIVSFAGILAKGVERHGTEEFDRANPLALEEIAKHLKRLYAK